MLKRDIVKWEKVNVEESHGVERSEEKRKVQDSLSIDIIVIEYLIKCGLLSTGSLSVPHCSAK